MVIMILCMAITNNGVCYRSGTINNGEVYENLGAAVMVEQLLLNKQSARPPIVMKLALIT